MTGSPRVAEKMRTDLAERATEYNQQLKGSRAEQYLLNERGFTHESISYFQLGFVETPMKSDRMHQGRIVIPYHTRTGVVALRSTSVPDLTGSRPEPKYLPWMTGDISRPFNVTSLDTAEEVLICEGELDCITAWMLGFYAVGIAGVAAWKDVYQPLFRYRKVTIVADMDDGSGQGMDFAKKVAGKLGGCSIVPMERGHDLNSFFVERGGEATLKHIKGDSE